MAYDYYWIVNPLAPILLLDLGQQGDSTNTTIEKGDLQLSDIAWHWK